MSCVEIENGYGELCLRVTFWGRYEEYSRKEVDNVVLKTDR